MGSHIKYVEQDFHVRTGVISISSTRFLDNDESGSWIVDKAKNEGCNVLIHEVVRDDENIIRNSVLRAIREYDLQVVLTTGGTGISPKDVTIEALVPLFFKELVGFGYVFAKFSYDKIGSASIMSRATAGIIGKTVLFCIPGSKDACELACENIIFPELKHIIFHLNGT